MKIYISRILILIFIGFIQFCRSFNSDELNDNVFDDYLLENDIALIEFYQGFAINSEEDLHEFNKAAEFAEKHSPPFQLARLDVNLGKNIIEKYQIDTFPTIKLFFNQTGKLTFIGDKKA